MLENKSVIGFLDYVLDKYTESDFKEIYKRFLILKEVPVGTNYDTFFNILTLKEDITNYVFGKNEFRDYIMTVFGRFYVFHNSTFRWNILFDVVSDVVGRIQNGENFIDIWNHVLKNYPEYTYSTVMRICLKRIGFQILNDNNWFYVFPDPWFIFASTANLHELFPEPYKSMYFNEINEWISQNS